MAHRT